MFVALNGHWFICKVGNSDDALLYYLRLWPLWIIIVNAKFWYNSSVANVIWNGYLYIIV